MIAAKRCIVGLVFIATVAAGGCGSGGKSTSSSSAVQTTTAATPPPAPAPGGSPTDISKKPAIQKPAGAPPKTLVIRDLVKGRGAPAKSGDTLTVQYVGISFSSGQQFDASWDSGQPLQFQLGAGKVIEGWDKGVPGMKVGGRRQLIIPSDLAYKAQGQGPIGPNETLIFDIDLLRVG